MSTTERLAQALREVLATLKRENERAEGPIKDTIWHGPAETLFDFIENTLGAHEAEKLAGPVAEHCPFKRCQDQGAHCNGACHGLMPDGKTPLAAVPELRDDVDEGRCLSCAGEFCTAGPFCVACSNPVAPPSPLTEQLEATRKALGQERTPAYGDALALCRRLEAALRAAVSHVPVQNTAPPSPLAEQDKAEARGRAPEDEDDEPTTKELGVALHAAGHDFFYALRRAGAGDGAVRWVSYEDGTVIIFTRGEYRDRIMTVVDDIGQPVWHWAEHGEFRAGERESSSPAAAHDATPASPLAEQDKEDAELTPEMVRAAVHEWECAPASISGEELVKAIYAAIRAARAKKEQP